MTNGQRIIKYLALALAFFIILSIVKGIVMGIGGVSHFYSNNTKTVTKDLEKTTLDSTDINKLNISLKYSSLEIKSGNELAVDTNNSNVNIKENNKSLDISEDNNTWYNNNYKVIVYIPNTISFTDVTISNGAGEVAIDSISTDNFDYSIGAGKTTISNLNAAGNVKIDGGAGKLEITNGVIGSLDLDMGVGKTDIAANITKDSKISAGVGSLNLDLLNTLSNYKIEVDKGLGSITVNGQEMEDESTTGTGSTNIRVDGGVGAINITTR